MASNEFGKPALYREGVKCQEEDRKENGSVDQQEKYPSCLQNLKHYLWEFCSRTTVHGFNYLGERGRTIPERIWWLITIVIALYLCITLIIQTYDKWMNSPVIVTFATSQTPIWKIPFPAVTICAEVKSVKSRFNYTDVYLKKKRNEELTEKEAREFDYMAMVCDTSPQLTNKSLMITDERAVDFLMEVSPNYTETMFKVMWHGRQYNLTELFTPILTSEGLCYTFNMMDKADLFTDIVPNYRDSFSTNGKRSKWHIETGYSGDAGLDDAYPRRSFVAGLKGGLNIMFNVPHEDLDYACRDTMQGFKVIVHNPAEIPRGRQKYFRVPLDYSVTAAVLPNMMSTSEALVNYKPKHRQCYFSSERNLKYYRIYNQPNCLNECLIDFTLKTCGCVGFFMQREASTPICSASKTKCIVDARAIYLSNEVKNALKTSEHNSKSSTKDSNVQDKCDCLPACNSLEFNVETSQAEWKLKEFLEIERQAGAWHPADYDRPLNELHFSRLAMYFREMQFITSERNELYGQTDFWASCGGLMGLFTGFSFISALEILYYLTLRLICNLQKFGRHHWSGSEELLKTKKEID